MLNSKLICGKTIDDIMKKYKAFKNLISAAKKESKKLTEGLYKLSELADDTLEDLNDLSEKLLSKVNDKLDEFNDFANAIANGESLQDALAGLINCIGMDIINKYISVQTKHFGPYKKVTDTDEFKMHVKLSIESNIPEWLSDLGNKFDDVIADAFAKLENMIPQELIDELLKVLNCLEIFCDKIDDVDPTTIEGAMSMVGLNIHGVIDYSSDALSGIPLSSKKQNHASGLKGIVAKTKTSIAKGVDAIVLDPKPNKQESIFFSKTTGTLAVNI